MNTVSQTAFFDHRGNPILWSRGVYENNPGGSPGSQARYFFIWILGAIVVGKNSPKTGLSNAFAIQRAVAKIATKESSVNKKRPSAFMTDEQVLVLNFLQCSPETWFSKKEIARRAVRRKVFEENPHWADHAVADLVNQKYVQENKDGQVRLKKDEVLSKN